MPARIEKKGDLIYIKTPYHTEFVKTIKLIPKAIWKPSEKAWVVPSAYEEIAKEIVERYFPKEPKSYLIYFDYKSPSEFKFKNRASIDGRNYNYFAVDYGKFYDTDDIEIINSKMETGGSRRYPIWHGVVLLRFYGGKEFTYSPKPFGRIIVTGHASLDPYVAEYMSKELVENYTKVDEPVCKQTCDKLASMGYSVTKCEFIIENDEGKCNITGEKKEIKTPVELASRTELIQI